MTRGRLSRCTAGLFWKVTREKGAHSSRANGITMCNRTSVVIRFAVLLSFVFLFHFCRAQTSSPAHPHPHSSFPDAPSAVLGLQPPQPQGFAGPERVDEPWP